mgnify:CR=1 FL=1
MKKNNNKVWIAVIAVLVVVIAALIVVLVRRKPKDDVEKVTSEEAIQTETEATPETASDATEAATTEAQATQDCFVKVTNSNSWESANGYSGQLDSTITNKTSGALKNWEIRMTVPDKTTLDSSWNGTFKLDGTTLSVKCVDYNAEVPANGNLKDIGVIVTVPSQADLKAICDSAVLYVDGKDITAYNSKQLTGYRRDDIGFVFQFYNLVPNLTALENVELALQISKDPLDAQAVLEEVGLGERKNNFPAQLSGGEQQRVSIARALAKNPKLLLCDEPTGALDYNTGKSILKLLQNMCREKGMTVIIITHNQALAPMADRLIHIKNGQVARIESNENPTSIDEIEW